MLETMNPAQHLQLHRRSLLLAVLFALCSLVGCTISDGARQPVGTQKTLKQQADSCLSHQNYIDALELYIKSVKEADEAGDSETKAAATCNIGIVYGAFNDLDKASYYFEKAYHMADANGYDKTAAVSAMNLLLCASADTTNGEFLKASEYCRKYSASLRNPNYWTTYLGAHKQSLKGDTHVARKMFYQTIKIAEEEGLQDEFRTMVYVDIAKSWLKENKTDSALKYYKLALKLNGNYSNQKKEIYTKLNRIYMAEGMTDSIAKYQNSLLQLLDSIYNVKKFNKTRSTLDEYEEQIVKNDINRISRRFVISVVACIILAILLGIIIFQYVKRREAWKIMKRNYDSLLEESEKSRVWRERCLDLEEKLETIEKSTLLPQNPSELHPLPEDREEMNLNSENNDADSTEVQEKTFVLNEGLKQNINLRIMQVVDDGSTIYDPDFSLNIMASILKINSKYISLAINEIYGENFKTFINRCRIDEVCRRLSDNEKYGNLTIAAIAAECGFKSVSNFITIFKRQVGMSPKIYRNLAE